LDSSQQTAINQTLDELWIKFRPQLEERVGILETAAAAVSANQLSLAGQQEANATAHKLAGVLGIFGLNQGTILARELEIMYSGEGGPEHSLVARVSAITAELRTMIESRK
jgi:HPt (histidine-containing phosphotransfer) domain-containing protein